MTGHVHHRGGSGSPLVLLHGFTDTWHAWDPVVPALEQKHEVIVLALPGHVGGYEFGPSEDFSVNASITALERDFDDAGIERAHLVGSSLGGWAALHLAARGRARSVVGLAPAGGWEHKSREGRRIRRYFANNYRQLRFAGPRAAFFAKHPRLRAYAMSTLVARPRQISQEAAEQMIRGAYECPIYKRAIKYSRQEGVGPPPERIPADIPVRIAWGTKDRVLRYPACTGRLRDLVPHAEWIEFEGLGHLPMWDDPELTARTILEFTAKVDSAAAAPA